MQHHTDTFYIAKILINHLEGNLSEVEKQHLAEWLEADPQNERLLRELKTDEYLRKELKLLHSFDEQKAFEKIRETLSKRVPLVSLKNNRIRRMVGVAAAAIVLLAVSATIFYLYSPKQEDRTIVQVEKSPDLLDEKILPGGNIATLTLSDGSVISLNDTENGVLTQEGNVDIVKLKDGQIVYGKAENTSKEILYNIVSTPRGGQYNLTLSDGTKVWLNAASSLRFPASFSNIDRRVEMEGEVYFDIAADSKHPFIVLVNGAEILVTGTQFNVDAYQDESFMKVTLLEGNVSLKNKNEQISLTRGQQAEFAKAGKFLIHKKIDLEEVIAWKEGLFHFNKADIKTVMQDIARWYDVEVEFTNSGKNKVFKGEMQRDLELSQVIKILNKHHINIELSGRKMIVSY